MHPTLYTFSTTYALGMYQYQYKTSILLTPKTSLHSLSGTVITKLAIFLNNLPGHTLNQSVDAHNHWLLQLTAQNLNSLLLHIITKKKKKDLCQTKIYQHRHPPHINESKNMSMYR